MILEDLGVLRGLVVEGGDIDRGGELVLDGAGIIVEARGGGARAVFLVDDVDELLCELAAIGASLFGDLVADAPQHDAGVIAIAAHEFAQVGSYHSFQYLESPLRTLGISHMSKASSITSRPMRSVSSSSSGAGGLWLVRMALTPIDFMISNCRSRARRLMAAPSAPRSWCMQTPLKRCCRPFSRKPLSLEYSMVRMPNGVT